MKAVLVMHPGYVRKMDISDVTLCVLGDLILDGDVLFDPASNKSYVAVGGPGFPPAHGPETKDQVAWSRERAGAFRGKCNELNGRLLVDASLLRQPWVRLVCSIKEMFGKLPVRVPLVGRIVIGNEESCSVAAVRENGEVWVIATVRDSTSLLGETVRFQSQGPRGSYVEASLLVSDIMDLPSVGEVLEWNDDDVRCRMV